jgi:hypothetical protein
MRGCGTVNHVGVRAFVSKVGSTLRTIDLDGCSRLGDETIQAIAEHCPLLRQITYPPYVTAAAAHSFSGLSLAALSEDVIKPVRATSVQVPGYLLVRVSPGARVYLNSW